MPYIEARNKFGRQKPTAIIIKPSFTTSEKGAAYGIAYGWFLSNKPWWSGHYSIDARKTYRSVIDTVIAGTKEDHDRGGIRIAVCAEPLDRTVMWHPKEHKVVLHRLADLVADLVLCYGINLKELNAEETSCWRKRPSRRRGGLIIEETSGWDSEAFLNEVKHKIAMKKHL